ncbi:MAG: protease modulator HflC [Candidatus Neomarinimicrobiota bacterium]|nr:MAG: protease modulator HflC [Candidatus Neomarinimicrobiota bacterium]
MKGKVIASLIIMAVVIFLIAESIFILDETQQAIITQFGKPVGGAIRNAGVHFKMPFIQKVIVFDKRLLEWDGEPQEIPTKDNKFIKIDTFARWRIIDPLAFYKSVRSEAVAQSRLDDILDGTIRDEIANRALQEIVRNSDRPMVIPEIEQEVKSEADTLSWREVMIPGAREEIAKNILDNVKKKLEELKLGIEVVDLKFKRIDYNPKVQEKVFERMISEQKRIAEKYRAIGQGEKQRILGKQDQKKKEILSEAYRKAQEIRGQADAEATKIYAKAYNKSPESRKFYEFIKTLETYKAIFDTSTTMILSTDNELLKYIKATK